MDTTEYTNNIESPSGSIKRQKSQNLKDTTVSSISQEIESVDRHNNSFTVVQLKFVNEEDSFDTISLFDVKDFLNKISTSWKIIEFSNDSKFMTFTESDQQCINILINIKQMKIKEKIIHVEISKFKNQQNKGIVYMKQIRLLSNEEILNRLKNQDVVDIIRIKKTNEDGLVYDTGSFIIIFNGEVPEKVYLDEFLEIPVNKLKPKPMRCNHCQLIGHTIKRCLKIKQEMCRSCYQEMVSDDHICVLKCKNCDMNHKSDDKNCPQYKNEIEILEIKGKFGFSYNQAKLKLKEHKKEQIQHINSIQEERKKESQIIQDKYNSIVEKHRKLQVTFRKEQNEKKQIEQFVIPELKNKIEVLENKVETLENHIEEINVENNLNVEKLINSHLLIVEQMSVDHGTSMQLIEEENNRKDKQHQTSIDNFNKYKEQMEQYRESMDTGMDFIRELFTTEPTVRKIYNTFCQKKEEAGIPVLRL